MDPRLAGTIAFLVGIITSFGLLWAITDRFHKKINEKDTMMSFIIGLFAGIVVVIGHLYIISYGDLGIVIISSFILALGELLLYHIYLNRRKFRGRSDLRFIGIGFSLGIAGMYILFIIGHVFNNSGSIGPELLLGLALFCFAVSIMRISSVLLLSRGERSGKIDRKLIVHAFVGAALLGMFNLLGFTYLIFDFLWTFALLVVLMSLLSLAILFKDLYRLPDLSEEDREDQDD
ncbi:MAG: hypothetical protein ACMUIG_06965 [Thermoplasmatota archaeon]